MDNPASNPPDRPDPQTGKPEDAAAREHAVAPDTAAPPEGAATPERVARPPDELDHYARLLREAAQIKGVSLGRDAWRRLRVNRVAMASLVGLVVLALLALLTPALPLQPPQRVVTNQRYASPQWSPLFEESLHLRERLDQVPEHWVDARHELRRAEEEIEHAAKSLEQEAARLDKRARHLDERRRELQEAEKALHAAQEQVEGGRGDFQDDLAAYNGAEQRYRYAKRIYEWASETTNWTVGDVSWAEFMEQKKLEERNKFRQRIEGIVQEPYRQEGFGRLNRVNRMLVRVRLAVFGDWCIASICGRDELGRDLLSRLFWGARVSLVVGLVATLVSLVIGVSYGAIAGYAGGLVDDAMMRLVDVLYSIPFIFVVIYLITVLGEEQIKTSLEAYGIDRITIFFFVVGAIYWLTMARVVRGQVISLKNDQFVEAARVIGAGRARLIFLHLVPNLLSVIIVYLTLTIPRVMLFEAFLSFLGLGVEPPDVSWGLLANEGIRVITPVVIYWWLIVFPGVALGATLFALNFLGDGLRDALDPRLKHR